MKQLYWYRAQLSPFLMAVSKLFRVEIAEEEIKTLVDGVLNVIEPAESSFVTPRLEFGHLELSMNSFQHADSFKRSTKLLDTFSSQNSNLSQMSRSQGKNSSFVQNNLFLQVLLFCAGRFLVLQCCVHRVQFL